MKKLLLLILLCGASAKGVDTDSLSLFEIKTYQMKNIKQLFNKCLRLGFQGGKMWAGKWLFFKPSAPVVGYRGGRAVWVAPNHGLLARIFYRGSGGVLFLHGLKGLLRECGYGTPGEFIKYLEKGE